MRIDVVFRYVGIVLLFIAAFMLLSAGISCVRDMYSPFFSSPAMRAFTSSCCAPRLPTAKSAHSNMYILRHLAFIISTILEKTTESGRKSPDDPTASEKR